MQCYRVHLYGSILALLVFPIAVDARIWQVAPDGTGDAPTVQAAIDSAEAGDEVVLDPGTYTWTTQGGSELGMIEMKAGITLRSVAGPETTILDAESQERVIFCQDVGDQASIRGLTVQNGFPFVFGGGGILSLGDSRPTIEDCVISNNQTPFPGRGGGIYCEGAVIVDCQILDNVGGFESDGGGIWCTNTEITRCIIRGNRVSADGSSLGGGINAGTLTTIQDCWIEGNAAAAVVFGGFGGGVAAGGQVSIIRSTFVGNGASGSASSGGAVFCQSDEVSVLDCVFVGNMASFGGAVGASSLSQPMISGCSLVANSSGIHLPGGGTVETSIIADSDAEACSGSGTYSCTNFFGNALGNNICGTDGGGNFSADPEFCADDPEASLNLTLQEDSPCAPGNHPTGDACGLIGAAPVACGTVAVETKTWSEVKAFFR